MRYLGPFMGIQSLNLIFWGIFRKISFFGLVIFSVVLLLSCSRRRTSINKNINNGESSSNSFSDTLRTIPFQCLVLQEYFVLAHGRIQRGGGAGVPDPPGKSQNIGFLCNTGPDPPKNQNAAKPAFKFLAIIGTPVKRHLNGISLAGGW